MMDREHNQKVQDQQGRQGGGMSFPQLLREQQKKAHGSHSDVALSKHQLALDDCKQVKKRRITSPRTSPEDTAPTFPSGGLLGAISAHNFQIPQGAAVQQETLGINSPSNNNSTILHQRSRGLAGDTNDFLRQQLNLLPEQQGHSRLLEPNQSNSPEVMLLARQQQQIQQQIQQLQQQQELQQLLQNRQQQLNLQQQASTNSYESRLLSQHNLNNLFSGTSGAPVMPANLSGTTLMPNLAMTTSLQHSAPGSNVLGGNGLPESSGWPQFGQFGMSQSGDVNNAARNSLLSRLGESSADTAAPSAGHHHAGLNMPSQGRQQLLLMQQALAGLSSGTPRPTNLMNGLAGVDTNSDLFANLSADQQQTSGNPTQRTSETSNRRASEKTLQGFLSSGETADTSSMTAAGISHQALYDRETPDDIHDTDGRNLIVLYMTCDDENLSNYQCMVRRQIELFQAREEDVDSNAQGRNKPILLGQVGIRCRHCSKIPPRHRTRGATYYPAKLNGLYQAAQNMASAHLCNHCQLIPDRLRQKLIQLRDRKSGAGGGKQYWADGVKALGVHETGDVLRFIATTNSEADDTRGDSKEGRKVAVGSDTKK